MIFVLTGAEAKLSKINQELSLKYGGTFISAIIYNYDSSQLNNIKIELDRVLCRIVLLLKFEGNKQHATTVQSKIGSRIMGVNVFRI